MADRRRASRLLFDEAGALPAFSAPRPATAAGGPDLVEQAFRRGVERGRAEGERAATETCERRVAELHREVATALRGVSALHAELAERCRAMTGELALAAASRIVRETLDAGHPVAARALDEALAALPDNEPLEGSDPLVDAALAQREVIQAFLTETREDASHMEATLARLREVLGGGAGRTNDEHER